MLDRTKATKEEQDKFRGIDQRISTLNYIAQPTLSLSTRAYPGLDEGTKEGTRGSPAHIFCMEKRSK